MWVVGTINVHEFDASDCIGHFGGNLSALLVENT